MAAPILVITGPPGTGKTTVAAAVAARYELSAVVHGDSFFDAIVSGFVSPHLPASREQNDRITEITATTAAGYAVGGWNTILEGVFGPWYLPAIERVATDHGADVHVAFLDAPLQVCTARVAEREGHDEKADIVKVMHRQFTEAVRWPTFDSTVSTDRLASQLEAAFGSGELRWPRHP